MTPLTLDLASLSPQIEKCTHLEERRILNITIAHLKVFPALPASAELKCNDYLNYSPKAKCKNS